MKHNFKKICLALTFLVCCGKGFTQNLSNKGIDFWVGYGHHQFMEAGGNNSQEMVIYLSAEQAANVTVSIVGTAWTQNYVVPAGNVIATAYIPKAGAIDARLISLPCSFVRYAGARPRRYMARRRLLHQVTRTRPSLWASKRGHGVRARGHAGHEVKSCLLPLANFQPLPSQRFIG